MLYKETVEPSTLGLLIELLNLKYFDYPNTTYQIKFQKI